MKEEIKSLHIEAIKLAEKQQPLWAQISKSRNTRTRLNGYWNIWNEMIATQKKWLAKDEELETLVAKALAIDPELSFNDYAKTYDPKKTEGDDEDYEKRHRAIRANFVRNIEKDEADRAKGLAKRAETSAPPRPLGTDFVSFQLAAEKTAVAARKPRGTAMGALKGAAWGDM